MRELAEVWCVNDDRPAVVNRNGKALCTACAKPKPQFYVQAHRYRGELGWHIGSRNLPWNISIFVAGRGEKPYESAIAIRNAYRWESMGIISAATRDAITGDVLLGRSR